jgi:predicted HD phosphohydrolase
MSQSLAAEVYECERRIASLERELKRLQQQEQSLREQHELVVLRQQSLHAQNGSRQYYFDLDQQNEALTDKIVDIIHSEIVVDEILQMHRRQLVTLRRYQARLKRSQMRTAMNCQAQERKAKV